MKLISVELKKTKAGDDYKVFTMDNGKKLSVFQFDSRYSEMNVGIDVPDSVLTYDAKYDNYKLNPLPGAPRASRGANTTVMREMAAQKAVHIEESQARRELGVRLAAAQRDAVLIVTNLYRDAFGEMEVKVRGEKVREAIEKWSEWFLSFSEAERARLEDRPSY